MHFKWDSSVARDISTEMDRLGEEMADCAAELDHCAAILREMSGGDLSEVIEKYISAAGELKKGLVRMEERFRYTDKGIARANELFESNESALYRKAEELGSGSSAETTSHGNAARIGISGISGTPPMFYNIPGIGSAAPIGTAGFLNKFPWPTLANVHQTVVIDQVTPGSGVITPPWLQGIIDTDYQQGRHH